MKKVENCRKTLSCTQDIKVHIVCITKYRKVVIAGEIAKMVREICQENEVEILYICVKHDCIYLLGSVPAYLMSINLV